MPSPVAAGDSGRDPNSPAEPAWISIARQKQRGMQQEQELDREKLVAPDVKSDTEKQNKEKERTEVLKYKFVMLSYHLPVVFFGSTAIFPVIP